MHKHASENFTMDQPKGDKCSKTTLQRTTQSRSRPRVSFNMMAEVNVIEEVLPVTTKLLLRGHGDGIIIVRSRSSRWNRNIGFFSTNIVVTCYVVGAAAATTEFDES